MRIKATTVVSFYSTPGLHNIAIQQCSVWYAHAWIYRTRSAKLILLLSREIRNGILCAYFYVLFSCRASLLFYIRNPLASAVAQPQFSRYFCPPRGVRCNLLAKVFSVLSAGKNLISKPLRARKRFVDRACAGYRGNRVAAQKI